MNKSADLIFVAKIAETFELSGRPGIVVVPESAWAVPLVAGNKLTLIKPNDDIVIAEIASFELVRTVHSVKARVGAISLKSSGLAKDDVPVGSTLWLA